MKENIQFRLNGADVSLLTEPNRPLLWVLRSDLGLTGSKYGCGKGQCGACTIVIGNKARRSCLVPLKSVAGKQVTTIEGLAKQGRLHPLQQAFIDHDALQCGICIPGMIMNAYALLENNPNPTRSEIMRGMEANLCRCGTYKRIVDAIQSAAGISKRV